MRRHLDTCPCGEDVLVVTGLGTSFVVDPVEVFPEGDCTVCRGRGRLRRERQLARTYDLASEHGGRQRPTAVVEHVECPRCGGSGRVGEPIERGLIGVDAELRGRVLYGPRASGEAAHRRHACAVSLAA